jgi:hypothetical protein
MLEPRRLRTLWASMVCYMYSFTFFEVVFCYVMIRIVFVSCILGCNLVFVRFSMICAVFVLFSIARIIFVLSWRRHKKEQSVMNMVINIGVPYRVGDLLTSWESIRFSRWTLLRPCCVIFSVIRVLFILFCIVMIVKVKVKLSLYLTN